MSNIVLAADVKTILGISGTTQDALIAIHIETVQETLYAILGVTDLYSHTVTREIVPVYDSQYFYVDEFPVTSITGIFRVSDNEEITGYTPRVDYKNSRKIWLEDSDGDPYNIAYDEIKVTYVAGYVLGTGEDAININIPKSIQTAVSFMIGGLLAEQAKKGGVKQYRVGSKEVVFEENQARYAIDILNRYMAIYRQPIIVS